MERVGRVSTFAEILVRTGRACLSGYPCSAVLRLVALDGTQADTEPSTLRLLGCTNC